jgi:hypothetical protein
LAASRVHYAGQGQAASGLQLAGDYAHSDILVPFVYTILESVNICFMIWDNIILWYVLENLMYQVYFTTLVYYFAKKYFEKIIPE